MKNTETNNSNNKEYYTVNLLHIIQSLWKRAWIIILCGIIGAGAAFAISSFLITPLYSSSIMLYVNNGQISLGKTSFSISSSEITAAQSLVKTYGEILNNRTTLQRVIDKTKIPYTYKELSGMVASAPSNDTEIIRVTVTSPNPYEASDIANCIAEVLPHRIAEIIDGASMEVVDAAVPAIDKVSPSNTQNTALGLFLGVLLSVAVLVFFIVRDDTIHSEEYITQTYDYPILARVPDLAHPGAKNRGYYAQKSVR